MLKPDAVAFTPATAVSVPAKKAGRAPIVWMLLAVMFMAGCTTPPKGPSFPVIWKPSPSFDERRPVYVILHHTGSSPAARGLQTLTNPARKVSAHYLVGRDGAVYQLVDERYRAWHAGVSRWATNTDLNSSSLGIELDNNGNEPFSEAQIDALLKLLKDIQKRYRIPAENFIGHADITPGRKVDPSHYFPWELLAQEGFGRWCHRQVLPDLPFFFNTSVALQALGYDTTRMQAAVRTFRLHYFADNKNSSAELTELEQRMLYCMVEDSPGEGAVGIEEEDVD